MQLLDQHDAAAHHQHDDLDVHHDLVHDDDALSGVPRAGLGRRASAQAGKFVGRKKGPISSACRDAIERAFAPVLGAIDASKI